MPGCVGAERRGGCPGQGAALAGWKEAGNRCGCWEGEGDTTFEGRGWKMIAQEGVREKEKCNLNLED